MTKKPEQEPEIVRQLRELGVKEDTSQYDRGETRITLRPLRALRKRRLRLRKR